MFNKLGPDTGYDCINNYAPSSEMADFLNALNQSDELPKTIIYSLNPNDNQAIGTIFICNINAIKRLYLFGFPEIQSDIIR